MNTIDNNRIPKWFEIYKMKTEREIIDLKRKKKRQVNNLSNRKRGNDYAYPYLSMTNDDGREPNSFPVLASVDSFRNLSNKQVLNYMRFYKIREDSTRSNRYNLARFCGCTSKGNLLQTKSTGFFGRQPKIILRMKNMKKIQPLINIQMRNYMNPQRNQNQFYGK